MSNRTPLPASTGAVGVPLDAAAPRQHPRGVTDVIRKLIERLSPNPVCDDCIADKLELADRPEVRLATQELTASSQFERRRDTCSLCGGKKLTTRYA